LLEELDEELLLELDDIVRENQLAFLPFAKSGRAEANLLEQHADLAGALARARERKIDSMRLRSRLHEDEERSASLNRFRVGSWGKSPSSTTVMDKTSPKSPNQTFSPGASPALVAEDSGADLLFEMDEEKAHHRVSPRLGLDPTSPDLQSQDLGNALEVGSPNLDRDNWREARGKQISGSVSTDASSLGSSFHRPQYSSSPAASRTPQNPTLASGSASQNPPWSTVRSTSSKTDLKDIMAEASVSRPSNLTLAMNARSSEHAKGIQKISQKERKKMQKQQPLQTEEVGQAVAISPSKPSAITTPTPTSPWRPIRPSPKTDLNQPVLDVNQPTVSSKAPIRPPIRTTMTMRQTVAGAPSIGKSPSISSVQTRSVSTPTITPFSKPTPPQIQSIRHTPAPTSTSLSYTAQSSMTDILLQQQIEKTAVKEAVAKRSLQEIQQQQEFEEWFDSESRRVQEEEAQATAAAAAASRDGRGKRGRGRGGHKRGSGRGGTKAIADGLSVSPTSDRRGIAHKQAQGPARDSAPFIRERERGAPRAWPG
jgi:inhibitor of Bruton tyrosine kinase